MSEEAAATSSGAPVTETSEEQTNGGVDVSTIMAAADADAADDDDDGDESEDDPDAPPKKKLKVGRGKRGGKKETKNKRKAYLKAMKKAHPERSVYINNLPWTVTRDDVAELFGNCGHIIRVTVPIDKEKERAKGYAIVEFEEESSVQTAVAAWNGKVYQKRRQLTVERCTGGIKPSANATVYADMEESTTPKIKAQFELPEEMQEQIRSILREYATKEGEGLEGKNLSWLKHAWESQQGKKLEIYQYGFLKLGHAIGSIKGIRVERTSKNMAVAKLVEDA